MNGHLILGIAGFNCASQSVPYGRLSIMTQNEDALAAATKLVEAQRPIAKAAADALGLKVGSALQEWFGPYLERYVAANTAKFDKLTAEEMSLLKKTIQNVPPSWADEAQELASGDKIGIMPTDEEESSPQGNIMHYIYRIVDSLLRDLTKTAREAVGSFTGKFEMPRPQGSMPNDFTMRLQPQLDEYRAQMSKLEDQVKEENKWKAVVKKDETVRKWNEA